MPKITEMSFVSVPRSLFEEAQQKMIGKINQNDQDDEVEGAKTIKELSIAVRLASNVHTRQLNPKISEVEWQDYENARRQKNSPLYLKKSDLIHKNTFAQEWPGVHHFLELAPKPACLIAHNGIHFDYRLLHFELERNQLNTMYPIPDGVYFLDSYLSFLDLEFSYQNSIKESMKFFDWKQITNLFNSAMKNRTKNNLENNDDSKTELLRRRNIEPQITPTKKNPSKNIEALNIEEKSFSNKAVKRNIGFALRESDLIFHPVQVMNKSDWSPAKRRRMRQDLFKRSNNDEWNLPLINDYFYERGNFCLQTLFKNIIQEDFEVHRAQADTEALLQVCLAYGKEFLSYLDNYSIEYSKIIETNSKNFDTKNLI